MKYIILTFVIMIVGCKNEPEPCKCDLLDEKENYFIKSGKLVETNSNAKALEEGKEIEVEVSVSGNPSDLIKKLGKIDANGKIRVPLIDFDKYEYVYQMNMNENSYDRNMLMYFLTYCSSYSSFHKKIENCEPSKDWQSKVDELRSLYLKPENPNKIEKTDIHNRKNNPQEPEKENTIIQTRPNNEMHECIFFILDENGDPASDVRFYSEFNIGISNKEGEVIISSPNDLPKIIHLTLVKDGFEKIDKYFDREPETPITLKKIKK